MDTGCHVRPGLITMTTDGHPTKTATGSTYRYEFVLNCGANKVVFKGLLKMSFKMTLISVKCELNMHLPLKR